MVLETDRPPKYYIRVSAKATWEIMEDIKSMLYNYKTSSHALLVARWLGRNQMTHQYQYHDELQTI
ncbi:hypothetical protein GB937_009138 [Aspergillus fischeri]|nr:hypothetical protein GB937_009138 [Aspergillus fischeri]